MATQKQRETARKNVKKAQSGAREKRTISTDASWHALTAGPVRSSDILDGEGYDAREEKDGWTTSSYFENEWENVEVGSASSFTSLARLRCWFAFSWATVATPPSTDAGVERAPLALVRGPPASTIATVPPALSACACVNTR